MLLNKIWSRLVDKYNCVWRNTNWPASCHISTKSYQWLWNYGCSLTSCPGHLSVWDAIYEMMTLCRLRLFVISNFTAKTVSSCYAVLRHSVSKSIIWSHFLVPTRSFFDFGNVTLAGLANQSIGPQRCCSFDLHVAKCLAVPPFKLSAIRIRTFTVASPHI